jgi:hypothetical protein
MKKCFKMSANWALLLVQDMGSYWLMEVDVGSRDWRRVGSLCAGHCLHKTHTGGWCASFTGLVCFVYSRTGVLQ